MAFLTAASAGSRATVWAGLRVGAVPTSGTGTIRVTRLLVDLGGLLCMLWGSLDLQEELNYSHPQCGLRLQALSGSQARLDMSKARESVGGGTQRCSETPSEHLCLWPAAPPREEHWDLLSLTPEVRCLIDNKHCIAYFLCPYAIYFSI